MAEKEFKIQLVQKHYKRSALLHKRGKMRININVINNIYIHIIFVHYIQRIEKKMYVSFEALIQDLKAIVHECHIHDQNERKKKNMLLEYAVHIFEFIQHELDEISLCIDCYLSSMPSTDSESFVRVCVSGIQIFSLLSICSALF